MAEKARKAVAVELDDHDMAALGREMLAGSAAEATIPGVAPGQPQVSLRLDDLIRDEHGEVVLFNDSGVRSMAVETNAEVVARGAAEPHVTAAGEDVSGLRFMSFDNGLTLYYQDGLDLIVRSEQG
jgi:hypothetical protein